MFFIDQQKTDRMGATIAAVQVHVLIYVSERKRRALHHIYRSADYCKLYSRRATTCKRTRSAYISLPLRGVYIWHESEQKGASFSYSWPRNQPHFFSLNYHQSGNNTLRRSIQENEKLNDEQLFWKALNFNGYCQGRVI